MRHFFITYPQHCQAAAFILMTWVITRVITMSQIRLPGYEEFYLLCDISFQKQDNALTLVSVEHSNQTPPQGAPGKDLLQKATHKAMDGHWNSGSLFTSEKNSNVRGWRCALKAKPEIRKMSKTEVPWMKRGKCSGCCQTQKALLSCRQNHNSLRLENAWTAAADFTKGYQKES